MKNWLQRYDSLFGLRCDDYFIKKLSKKQIIRMCQDDEKHSQVHQRCPICGDEIYTKSYHEEVGLVETHTQCRDHFEESWSYGRAENYSKVGDVEAIAEFGYSDDIKEIELKMDKYRSNLLRVKKAYKNRINKIKNRVEKDNIFKLQRQGLKEK